MNRKALANLPELEILQTYPKVVGGKQLRKALRAGKVISVFLACDADPAITEPLEALCRQKEVPCTWVPDMRLLGCACGIDVGAAAAAAVAKDSILPGKPEE